MIGYSGANVQVVRQAPAFSSTLPDEWKNMRKGYKRKGGESLLQYNQNQRLSLPSLAYYFFLTFSLPIWILISSALIFRGSKTSSLAYLSFSSFSLCSGTTRFVHGGWVSRKVYGQQVGTKWFIMFKHEPFARWGRFINQKIHRSIDAHWRRACP